MHKTPNAVNTREKGKERGRVRYREGGGEGQREER